MSKVRTSVTPKDLRSGTSLAVVTPVAHHRRRVDRLEASLGY